MSKDIETLLFSKLTYNIDPCSDLEGWSLHYSSTLNTYEFGHSKYNYLQTVKSIFTFVLIYRCSHNNDRL